MGAYTAGRRIHNPTRGEGELVSSRLRLSALGSGVAPVRRIEVEMDVSSICGSGGALWGGGEVVSCERAFSGLRLVEILVPGGVAV
jgi:hypothetical protein